MNVRTLLRIARWEVARNAGGLDRQTATVLVFAVLATGAVAGATVATDAGPESGIYRVGVGQSSPYYAPAAENPTFAVRDPDAVPARASEVELLYSDDDLVAYADSQKGRAALSEFRTSVAAYNDRQMAREDNQTAANPVSVTLSYAEQSAAGPTGADSDGSDDGSAGGSGGDGSAGDGTGDGSTSQPSAPSNGLGGIGSSLSGGSQSGAPSDISPPFPFQSLVLAFLFVVPMNFVIQAYGSSMLSERLKRRGELLLVSPVSRGDVIAGKTLPYFLGAMAVVTAITLALRLSGVAPGGSHVAVLAIAPVAALFLGATFCGAMFARSFKELTFVTVTITVSLTSYAFVPAIFTNVTPISLISPLTIVVRDLQGEAVALSQFLFATGPPALTAAVLFGLGAGLYREEDMFTQRPIPLKVLDALAGRIERPRSAFALSAILVPFVFVAELLAVALLFLLGQFGVVLVLVSVVIVEEVAKSVHLYAGYAHRRYERTLRSAVLVGALSGAGFFVAEKLLLVAQVVGLQEIDAGRAALVGAYTPESVSLPLVAALLLAPLVLHVVTAVVSSIGASKGRRPYVLALLAAMAIHFAYNYTVVTYVGV